MAHLVDDEIQPVDEVLPAPLELDERSHVVRNILGAQVGGWEQVRIRVFDSPESTVRGEKTDRRHCHIYILKSLVPVVASPHKTHLPHSSPRSTSSESGHWHCSAAGPCM